LIAASAPILGAFADNTGRRRPWVFVFTLFYAVGAFSLWWTIPDGSTLVLMLVAFGIGLIGAEFTTIFINAYLPELRPRDEIGKISGTGFALGYAGGVIALFIMLLFFAEGPNGTTFIGLDPGFGLDPEAREGTRFVGPFVAAWFIVFMIPFFLWVRDDRRTASPGGVRQALTSLIATIRSLPGRSSLFAYLGSSMLYRDGLNALYGFGGTYAVLVLNWEVTQVGIFGIIGALTSAVVCWIGGKVDSAKGPKPLIITMIFVLIALCAFLPGMTPDAIWGIETDLVDPVFMVCGAIIGGAGGVLQSASRTMMVRHADPDRASEAFGLYALSGKATAFLGPLLIGVTTFVLADARLGVIPLIGLFVLGLILLFWVKADGEAYA
jgi:UMF1 family MFS transporter